MAANKSIIKGFLDIAILCILRSEEMHGYSLVKALSQHDSGALSAGEGTIYPLLTKLEAQGLIKSRWDKQRKYYSLTAKGGKALETKSKAWMRFSQSLTFLLGQPT